jgi:hypothetical protein
MFALPWSSRDRTAPGATSKTWSLEISYWRETDDLSKKVLLMLATRLVFRRLKLLLLASS